MTIFKELDRARGKDMASGSMLENCEKCGVDRTVLWGMLIAEVGSDDFEIAWKILANCKACKEAYRANLLWLCENIPES